MGDRTGPAGWLAPVAGDLADAPRATAPAGTRRADLGGRVPVDEVAVLVLLVLGSIGVLILAVRTGMVRDWAVVSALLLGVLLIGRHLRSGWCASGTPPRATVPSPARRPSPSSSW